MPTAPSTISDPISPSWHPQTGDRVYVRSAQEILDSVNDEDCLDGLPFMPEMLAFCDRELRVASVANKTCVNTEPVYIGSLSNCFVLQTPRRCDGAAHGGCQMGCKFFWRSQWLRAEAAPESDATSAQNLQAIESRLSEMGQLSNSRFRCQATELVQIAKPTSALQPQQYVADIKAGIPVLQILKFLAGVIVRKVTRSPDHLVGSCSKRTPTAQLGLSVGDRVRVKDVEEIIETLDRRGCNRGLWFDKAEMKPFCGKELVVSRVLNRLIDEKTGELKTLKQPCVVLAETECSGVFRRFCSRGMLHFWRAIWLEKVD